MKTEEHRPLGAFGSYLEVKIEKEDLGKTFRIYAKLSPGCGGPSVLFLGFSVKELVLRELEKESK